MFNKLSDTGSAFWLFFTLFLIIAVVVWWCVIRRWGSCKTRAVLGNYRIWLINIFNVFAIGGFISNAPCVHWVIAILIYWIVAIIIGALWRNGGCNWRARWNRSYNNNSNDSCGTNNDSNVSSCGSEGYGRREFNYRVNWRVAVFVLFWALVGALFGAGLRHVQLTCFMASYKVLAHYWWTMAILALLLFGLLWQVAGRWANCTARCVLLNKRTWVLIYFWFGLWLGTLSGSSWVYGFVLIIVWSIIRWGLQYTWSYFCVPRWYVWSTAVAFFLAYIIGVYIIRYLEMPDGTYFAKCGTAIIPGFKNRFM